MNILILIAGTNEPSNSATLANEFINGINKIENAHIDLIHLKDLSIEHFNLKHYETRYKHESDFCKIENLVKKANGIVIATPVWNFGVPAHLKNLLDRMGSFALDDSRSKGTLNGKPFYLIFTGGAPKIAWKSLIKKTTDYVPQTIKYFGGTICSIYFEPKCTIGKGKFGLVVDKRTKSLEYIREEGTKFANLVKEYATTGKLPAKQYAIKKIYSFGQNALDKMTK